MTVTYKVTTEPSSEPITLDQFKDALRVTGCDFDEQLTELLKVCRRQLEYDAKRKLVTQTVTMYLDEFPGCDEITIRMIPVTAVNSVKYYDGDGTQQTLSSSEYWTNLVDAPPVIQLKSGYVWPLTQLDRPNAVEVEFVCGAAVAAVDVTAKLAIKELGKMNWKDCDGSKAAYERLTSLLSWTGYGVAQV
jgi:uncharacterized phiE125 gp8 family phage protein